MAKIPVFFVALIGLFLTKNVFCLDFCGAEHIPKCKKGDDDCVKFKLEPGVRKWIIKGQPGYFMEQIDPMTFNELPVKTNKGICTLKNVKLTGFSEAKLLETKTNFDNNTLKYSYDHKFELLAEDFIDENGKTLLNQKPLILQLENLVTLTETDFIIVKRCDNEHIRFTDSKLKVKPINDEDLKVKSGLNNVDLELKLAIGNIVGSSVSKKIATNFRTLVTIVPLSGFYI